MRKRKRTRKNIVHRVYVTYFPDDTYYIGYSSKPDKQFQSYFGSSRIVKEPQDNQTLRKEVVAEYSSKALAKMQEMLLQLEYRLDDRCINDMIHIRLRMKYINDFTPITWKPKNYKDLV